MNENKRKLKFNLFPKILLTTLSVALLPLGIYWYLSDSRYTTERGEIIRREFKQTSESLVRTVDDWVDMNQRVLRQNAALVDMTSMQLAKQVPILTTIANTYNWLIGAHVIRQDGTSEARSDGQAARYLGDRAYFQQVMHHGKPFGSEVVVTRATGKPGLALSAPIHNAEKNLVGVLFLMSHLSSVSQAVMDVKIGQTGFAILLDETGKVIAHGRPEALKETLQDMHMHPVLHNTEAAKRPVVHEEQGKHLLVHTQKTQQGWTLILQQDYDEAYAPLHEARHSAVLLLGVTVVMFSALAYVLSQRLAKPIRQLTATAEQISLGQLDKIVLGIERGDELGALARAISRLVISMKIAITMQDTRDKTAA